MMKLSSFDVNAWKERTLPPCDTAVQLRDGGHGWFSWKLVEQHRHVEDNWYLKNTEFYSIEWNWCFSDCDREELCISCHSIAVPLWDGTFALARNCEIHYSGEFFLQTENAAELIGGGFAHTDEVVDLACGWSAMKPHKIPIEKKTQELEKIPEQKEKTPTIVMGTNTREESPSEMRNELVNNLNAAKEAIFRCTVERDSSLAEYAHLFAQRLEQQVISVIEDGLEALSIYEEAGEALDENTKKRLLNYVHLALKFKGLEESS